MRILDLKISCNKPEEQRQFFTQALGLNCTEQDDQAFSLQIGYSRLTFEKSAQFTPYHLAFRIPSNRDQQALEWLRERVSLLAHEGSELIDFKNWNAKSMYFKDPDGNILEFIAHRNLQENSETDFNANALIAVTEIGLATNQLATVTEEIIHSTGIQSFGGDPSVFRPLGNEQGLLICVDRTKKRWFPSDDKAFPSSFQAIIETANGRFSLQFESDRASVRQLNTDS